MWIVVAVGVVGVVVLLGSCAAAYWCRVRKRQETTHRKWFQLIVPKECHYQPVASTEDIYI